MDNTGSCKWMIHLVLAFHGCIQYSVTSLTHVMSPSVSLMGTFSVAMKKKLTRHNGTMLPSSMKLWCGQFLKAAIFKLLRWQIFPPPPEKAISRLITARCDLNCISLEMTWWREGTWLRMRKYYTDSHSNSLSGSETDDSELEKKGNNQRSCLSQCS